MSIPFEIDLLRKDLIWSFFDYHQYQNIYKNSADRIKLLNETAAHFFVTLHNYYWDRFALSIMFPARLCFHTLPIDFSSFSPIKMPDISNPAFPDIA